MECVDLSSLNLLTQQKSLVALRMECVDLSIALNRKNKLLLGRTPHGVRGFKYLSGGESFDHLCRTPHGVRGFKFEKSTYEPKLNSRTPHGVRGFKSP